MFNRFYMLEMEFYTLLLTRFRTYKIASPLSTKMTRKDDIYGVGVFKVPLFMHTLRFFGVPPVFLVYISPENEASTS